MPNHHQQPGNRVPDRSESPPNRAPRRWCPCAALSAATLAALAAGCGGGTESTDATGPAATVAATAVATGEDAPPAASATATSSATTTTSAPTTTDASVSPAEDNESNPTPFYNSLSHEVPGMTDVFVEQAVYRTDDAGDELAIDLYLPPGHDPDGETPAVVFVMGYPNDSAFVGGPLKDLGQYRSWGRLVAASQMVGVAYDTTDADDTAKVIEYLRANAAELGIDPDRIGIVAVSANVGTALSVAMQPELDFIDAAVFYYGLMYGAIGEPRETLDAVCAEIGCYGAELADYPAVRTDLPTLVVKAGLDRNDLNETIDHFVEASETAGAPITFVDYEAGVHGFDTDDSSSASAEIVADTVEFLRTSLT